MDLSFQKKKDEKDKKDKFFSVNPMKNSNNKYIDKFMSNFPKCLDLSDTPIKVNLTNNHNLIDFRVLSGRH